MKLVVATPGHLEVATTNAPARTFYESPGFRSRDRFRLMTCELLNDRPCVVQD